MISRNLGWLVMALLFVSCGACFAAPHHGEVYDLKQPDGSRVPAKVWGDEFYQRVESLDGYTLVRDETTGWICYAEVSADGSDFVSTGVVYEVETDTAGNNKKVKNVGKRLPRQKHLKLKKGAVLKKAKERRKELLGEKADEYFNFGLAEDGYSTDEAAAMATAPAPLTGSVVGLTVLIDFPDDRGTIAVSEVEDYCNQIGYSGYNNNGSIRDYFYDVSNGNLEYTNQVVGYYTANYNKSYYDDCDNGKARELIGEALNWLESQNFDFTTLSRDGSNRIIALNFFYAGNRGCGWAKGLWPHKGWYDSYVGSQGVRTGDYQITDMRSSLVIGTFCHENGHMTCDWPDLYDYGYESSGTGGYCLMSSGHGTNPQVPNPYFRDLRGWENIVDITDDMPGTVRTHTANSHTTFRYSHPTNYKEFFLVESRRRVGRHTGIPDEGMLIWHVDADGSNNNEQMTEASHYKVSVEQADGRFDLENGTNSGGSGDLFHANYRDVFNDNTLPDARWWDGSESGLGIRDIGPVGNTMDFTVDNVTTTLFVSPGEELAYDHVWSLPLPSTTKTFELANTTNATLNWTADENADWFDLSPSSGTLAAGASTTVSVVLNGAAALLGPAEHAEPVAFTDTTNDVSLGRDVVLNVIPKGLHAYWQFDQTTGYTASDATGNGFDGSLENMSFSGGTTAGKFGQALSFDGIDDFITVSELGLNTNNITIAGWLNAAAIQTEYAGIFSNRVDGAANFNFKKSNKLGYHWNNGHWTWSTDFSVPTNEWVFVAMVLEPDKVTMYMDDGTLRSDSWNAVHSPESFAGYSVIGRDAGYSSRSYQGAIDDLRIYNYALSSSEIALLPQGGPAECPKPANGETGIAPQPLSWIGGPVADRYLVYLGTNQSAVADATPSSPEYQGQTSETQWEFDWNSNSTYFWRVDTITDSGSTIAGAVWQFETGDGTGMITREVWNSITGINISDLTSDSRYPDQPDETGVLMSFETPVDIADDYGTRVHGFLKPKVTGTYKFWIAGDDWCELWLSSGFDPADASMIAQVPGWTGQKVWDEYPEQASGTISLVAGEMYYIKALHKESGGGDHLAVAWQGPDIVQQVIPGEFLMPYYEGYNGEPVFNNANITGAEAIERQPYSGSLVGTASDPEGDSILYSKAAGPDWLMIAGDGGMMGTPADADVGANIFTVRVTDQYGGYDEATLTIQVNERYTGELGMTDLIGFASHWLELTPTGDPADLNDDGAADFTDYAGLLRDWLETVYVPDMLDYWPIETDASNYVSPHAGRLYGDAAINTADAAPGSTACVQLDGDGDYVEISGYYGITGTASRTVTAWIKTNYQAGDAVTGEIVTWGRPDQTGKRWTMRLTADGALRQEVKYGYINGTTNIADNTWHHVAVVLEDDGSPDISEALLYVDGQLEPVGGFGPRAVDTGMLSPVRLGVCLEVAGPRFFKGLIDEVRIYDRALTADEISRLAQ
ncbi:M6 family metalloprotease domain protein [Anaerohalosphaera lusitana]|uniref:M6 family metalloprotease domain protein n=1 Tax=Anaerohalosphaera lusitana TaxID=1936003 RepID=A0A1U9NIH1_9BACT|nr:M6 family metalloprotease domain-containing protein [Anaerohalosphaera lusitana]AQT67729.1 M6 family metalloprotease domain protein [Anaerohalosphaera lusitana]